MNLSETAAAVGCLVIAALALLSVTGSSLSTGRPSWWTGRSPVAEWCTAVACTGWSAALMGSGRPVWVGLVLLGCAGVAALRVSQRADALHGGFTAGDTVLMFVLGVVVAAAMFLSLGSPTAVGIVALVFTVVAAYAAWNGALATPTSRMTVLNPGYSLGVILAGVSWTASGMLDSAYTITAGGVVLLVAGLASLVSGQRTTRRRIR